MEEDQDTGAIVLCAVRYCFGRRTYMPSLVIDWTKRHWGKLSLNDRRRIFRDVKEEIERAEQLNDLSLLGDNCDITTWMNFRKWMRDELDAPTTTR